MGKKKTKTEIEPWELQEIPVKSGGAGAPEGIIRKNFREPIFAEDTVRAVIGGKSYQVNDLGSQGLGISVPALDSFSAGSPCRVVLHIGADTLELNGTIAHLSPCDATGACRCGIAISKMPENHQALLQQFLITHHSRLFGEEQN